MEGLKFVSHMYIYIYIYLAFESMLYNVHVPHLFSLLGHIHYIFCCFQFHAVVGVLMDDTDPMVSVMKLEKAPDETYADIGGLDQQIQEIKVGLQCMGVNSRICTKSGSIDSLHSVE